MLVVQHGGFSAAELATGIDKSRLSRGITRLEQALGVQLLRRTPPHGTHPTAGERVYANGQRAVTRPPGQAPIAATGDRPEGCSG